MHELLRYHGADIAGFVLTFVSLLLLGDQRRSGFLVGAFGSVAWVWFGAQTGSLPTLVANCVFLLLGLRGFVRWRRGAGSAG